MIRSPSSSARQETAVLSQPSRSVSQITGACLWGRGASACLSRGLTAGMRETKAVHTINAGQQHGEWVVTGRKRLGGGGNGEVWRAETADGRTGASRSCTRAVDAKAGTDPRPSMDTPLEKRQGSTWTATSAGAVRIKNARSASRGQPGVRLCPPARRPSLPARHGEHRVTARVSA